MNDNRINGSNTEEQAKLVMLKLLSTFDKICRDNKIRYWLSEGTLLGAIRHGGFIPWDDDIDVAMLREDFNKFEIIAKDQLPIDMFLQTRNSDPDYPLYIVKLRDKYSTYEEENLRNCRCHKGIFIDIFLMDSLRFPKIQSFLKTFLHSTNYSKVSKITKCIQITIGRLTKYIINHLNLPFYEWLNSFFHCSLKDATIIGYSMEINEKLFYKKDYIFPLKEHVFEGKKYFVPQNCDAYLHHVYGDYMTLPPVEKRFKHHTAIYPFRHCNHKEILEWNYEKENS